MVFVFCFVLSICLVYCCCCFVCLFVVVVLVVVVVVVVVVFGGMLGDLLITLLCAGQERPSPSPSKDDVRVSSPAL